MRVLGTEQWDRDPYWCRPWPAAVALAKQLLLRPELVRGRRVCEVGAGLGIAGIAAAMAGAQFYLPPCLVTQRASVFPYPPDLIKKCGTCNNKSRCHDMELPNIKKFAAGLKCSSAGMHMERACCSLEEWRRLIFVSK